VKEPICSFLEYSYPSFIIKNKTISCDLFHTAFQSPELLDANVTATVAVHRAVILALPMPSKLKSTEAMEL
jgi:hypothetical protein